MSPRARKAAFTRTLHAERSLEDAAAVVVVGRDGSVTVVCADVDIDRAELAEHLVATAFQQATHPAATHARQAA